MAIRTADMVALLGRRQTATAGAAAAALLATVAGSFVAVGAITPGIWVGDALLLVLLLKSERRLWPAAAFAAFVAGLAAALAGGMESSLAAGLVLAHLLQVVAAAVAIVAFQGPGARLAEGDVLGHLRAVAIAVATPALGALVGSALIAARGEDQFSDSFFMWWSGSSAVVLMVLPAALSATRRQFRAAFTGPGLKRTLGAALAVVAIALAAAVLTPRPVVILSVPLAAVALALNPLASAVVTTAGVLSMLLADAVRLLGAVEGVPRSVVRVYAAVAIVVPFGISLLVAQLRDERGRIAESEKRFRLAMEYSAIGMAIVGLDGTWVRVNRAVCDLLGYGEEELQRLTFADLTHPQDIDADLAQVKRTLAGEIGNYRMEKRYIRKDGSVVWALLAVALMRDDDSGEPLYFISQIEDISARKQAETALAETESRWHAALDSGGQGVWDYDLRTHRAYYSPTYKAILGYSDRELVDTPDMWRELTHPEDVGKVESAAIDLVAGRTDNLRVEFRMRHKDGHWVWVVDRGRIIDRDASGKPLHMIGTHADVTVRVDAESELKTLAEKLKAEEERLRVTLDSIGEGVIATDVLGRVTFMNPRAEAETGWSEAEAIGRSVTEVFKVAGEGGGAALPDPVGACLAAGGRAFSADAVLLSRRGRKRHVRTTASLVNVEGGTVAGAVVVFRDTTQARRLQQRLAHSAAHDALTGLRNRAAFEDELASACSEVGEGNRQHAICVFDLDRFKAVNDSGGHAAGDAVLREVARVARQAVRGEDMVARLGGDEFAVLLRDCALHRAELIARRIVHGINALKVWHDGRAFCVGASAGVARIAAAQAPDAVIKEVDAACYAAKASGRGIVRVAGEGEPDAA